VHCSKHAACAAQPWLSTQEQARHHATNQHHPNITIAQGAAYSAQGYKPQRSKDESKERRKAIFSSIGEVRGVWLSVVSMGFRDWVGLRWRGDVCVCVCMCARM